nr:MAG TPA: hypothetical protein [Bacteriophage sp.]
MNFLQFSCNVETISLSVLDTELPFKGFSPTTWPYSYCFIQATYE